MTLSARLVLVVPVLAAAVLSGCDSGPDDAGGDRTDGRVLTIVSTEWNGWDPDHQPTPETTTVPVHVGATATVEGVGESDPVTFEVTQVMGSRVEVASSHRLAPEGESGGSDLTDLQDLFLVDAGRSTELDTPTLDGGVSYTLTLSS